MEVSHSDASDHNPAATLTGLVERVVFHAEDSGRCVLKVRDPKDRSAELITVTGQTPRAIPGEQIEAHGQWTRHPEYGRQFKADQIRLTRPIAVTGIVRFLGSGLIDGIGQKYAQRLVDKFGTNVFDVIEHESARLEEVDGIGKKRRQEIRESWMKQKSVHEIMVFLHQYGVTTARALRIHKTYGEEALTVLRDNPYRMATEIHGIGFKIADDIATKIGLQREAPQRLDAGLTYTLERAAESGHTCLPQPLLLQDAAQILAVAPSLIELELERMLATEQLCQTEVGGERFIYIPRLLRAETLIARKLTTLLAKPVAYPNISLEAALSDASKSTGRTLAVSQQSAVEAALKHRLLIITGGPGVGKTTIINTILHMLTAKGVKAVLAAPTGRAAQRLAESTGSEAKTLHRLLEFQGEGTWGRNALRPLEGDLFVIDESSMIDTLLMSQFLQALPDTAHLLMVGDADQLPSVGAGAVLHDLIQSGLIPCVKLTEIFRQAAESRIIQAAHAINQGNLPNLKPAQDGDFFFLEESDPTTIVQTIVSLVRDRLPAKYPLDPVRDIQVLTPMNQHALGARALNDAVQAAINPPSPMKYEVERFGQTFRIGDKVIQIRNNYEKEVFNGDIGRIISIETEPVQIVVSYENGHTARYEPGELDELRLAYAITIHKSQGSEFPCVIIPWSMAHYIMLDRSLLYTAITRGRKLVVMVGEKRALSRAVQQAKSRHRWTGLTKALSAPLPSDTI